MRIEDLKKWEKNPRTITASRRRILAKTLAHYGDLSGIVFNKRNQRLVGGHMRSEEIPNAEIEILERHSEPTSQGTTAIGWATLNGEKYAYREVDWDEETHAAAAIAANRGAGEWDWTRLKELQLDLDTGAFDMELTGFDTIELENLLAGVQASISGDDLQKKHGSLEDYAENYEDSDIRQISIACSASEFETMIRQIVLAQKHLNLITNTQVIQYLLADFEQRVKSESTPADQS